MVFRIRNNNYSHLEYFEANDLPSLMKYRYFMISKNLILPKILRHVFPFFYFLVTFYFLVSMNITYLKNNVLIFLFKTFLNTEMLGQTTMQKWSVYYIMCRNFSECSKRPRLMASWLSIWDGGTLWTMSLKRTQLTVSFLLTRTTSREKG